MDVYTYTKDEVLKNLNLMENHLLQIKEDRLFCLDCITKHAYTLWGLADEAVQFYKADPLWIEFEKWIESLVRALENLDEKTAYRLAEEARTFRKKIVAFNEKKFLTDKKPSDILTEKGSDGKLEHPLLLLHSVAHIHGSPGIVVDEARARQTPCTCYIGDHSELCFSEGVIGGLDEKQKIEFCKAGRIDHRGERLVKWNEAVRACQAKIASIPKGERLHPWLRCMGEELRKRGIEI